MAGRVLMPLPDSPDSARLLEWMNEVPRYSLNDQKPSDWTPFQGCDYCDGLCSVLESADSVRRLLEGQRVPIFQGQCGDLKDVANRGCEFASYLIRSMGYTSETDHGLDIPIDLAFRRIDATGPSSVRLISLVEGNRGEDVKFLYLVVATADSDPARKIASFLPDTDPMSPQSLVVVRRWLGDCASRQPGHEACPDVMPIKTKLPTRVVYVGTDNEHDPPRLHLGNGGIAGYTALSYCWGGSQRHQTDKSRIEQYMHALPVGRLPKSLQDAIFLTRALGIQYIWIDSLCIIQDCDEDKDREMTIMANIYKNAVLTISAARAESCDEGFLGMQEKRASHLQASIKLPMNCLNGSIGSVLLYPSRTQFSIHENTPIDKRAWTYQEQSLSRRVVSFFNDAIEWSCPSRQESDDRLKPDELNATDPAYLAFTSQPSGRSYILGQCLYLASESGLNCLGVKYLTRAWSVAVGEYTMGSLSNQDDRLPAIAGIASEFHNISGDVYVAGLWMSHLIQDLQWAVFRQLGERSANTGNMNVKYDAPTWSWASVHECMTTGFKEEYDLHSDRVEIIDCKVKLVSASAPFGSVNGGELKIRAPLKFLSDRQVKDMQTSDDDCGKFIGRIWFDRISWRHADELTSLRDRAAPHIESTGIWFLGLSKHADINYESSGLALAKRADGLFERVGLFRIDDGEDWLEYGTAELDELRSSWGDDYVVTTVTIV